MNARQLIGGLIGAVLLVAGVLAWRGAQRAEAPVVASDDEATADSIVALAEPPVALSPIDCGEIEPVRSQMGFESALPLPAQGDSEDDPDARMEAINEWVAAVAPAQLQATLEALSREELAGVAGQLLVRRWADLNPQSVAEWIAGLSEPDTRAPLQSALALAWSETDMDAALQWAQVLPEGRDAVIAQLGYELARENPVGALNLAAGLSTNTERDALILHSLRQWTVTDSAAVREWLQQWPAGELQQRALATFATTLATQDGDAAARFAVEYIPPGEWQNHAVIGVIQRWVQSDAAATRNWVESFPPLPLRGEATTVIAGLTGPAN